MDEIMNYENEGMETEIIETDGGKTGIGTGKALLIGVGVTAAVIAGVKLAKNAWAKHKAKKAAAVGEDDFVEVTDNQVNDETK